MGQLSSWVDGRVSPSAATQRPPQIPPGAVPGCALLLPNSSLFPGDTRSPAARRCPLLTCVCRLLHVACSRTGHCPSLRRMAVAAPVLIPALVAATGGFYGAYDISSVSDCTTHLCWVCLAFSPTLLSYRARRNCRHSFSARLERVRPQAQSVLPAGCLRVWG